MAARRCWSRLSPGTLLGGLGALLLALGAGCSVERHHRILSFFFDGVPDPHVQAAEASPAASPAAEISSPPAELPTVPVPTFSQHPPVAEGRCGACHGKAAPARGASSWLTGGAQLIVPEAELCARCHDPPEARYVHGPAGARRCDLCHVAHRSPLPHLLRYGRQEPLCRSCHTDRLFETRERHAGWSGDCVLCHDPHGSQAEDLLRPDWRNPVEGG